ncbi:MAG: helix-turn-helix domain-containing protein [Alphaproteobacteria bacterium]|nr:helix-turn-helix domain-containing protein [Alphaproteobacteria bacterium]
MAGATQSVLAEPVTQELLDNVSKSVVRVVAEQHREAFGHYATERRKVATLTIHAIESDPVMVRRREEDILADRICDVALHVQLEGMAEIVQGNRTLTLKPGAFAIVPVGIPYLVCYPEKGRKIILRIPHRALYDSAAGRDVEPLDATVFDARGLVPIVVDLVKAMTMEKEGELSDIEQFTLADSFLALVRSVVRSHAAPSAKQTATSQSKRLSRILCYLEENFSDHELTPARIAEDNLISLRYLHDLFKHSGTTVSRWMWERRLRAGREDLIDPKLANLTICDIAFRRGFSDSSHFSRAFKERFGIPPGQLRSRARGGILDVLTKS